MSSKSKSFLPSHSSSSSTSGPFDRFFRSLKDSQYSLVMVSCLFILHFLILYVFQLLGNILISYIIPLYFNREANQSHHRISFFHVLHILLDEFLHALFAFFLWSAVSLGARDQAYYSYHLDEGGFKKSRRGSRNRSEKISSRLERDRDDVALERLLRKPKRRDPGISSRSDPGPLTLTLPSSGPPFSASASPLTPISSGSISPSNVGSSYDSQLHYDELFVPTCVSVRKEKKLHRFQEHFRIFCVHISTHARFLLFAAFSACLVDLDHFVAAGSLSLWKATHVSHSSQGFSLLSTHSVLSVSLLSILLFLLLPFFWCFSYSLSSWGRLFMARIQYRGYWTEFSQNVAIFFNYQTNNSSPLTTPAPRPILKDEESLLFLSPGEDSSSSTVSSTSSHSETHLSIFLSTAFAMLSPLFWQLVDGTKRLLFSLLEAYRSAVYVPSGPYYLDPSLRSKISLCFFLSLMSNLLRDSTRKGLDCWPLFATSPLSLELVCLVLSPLACGIVWACIYPVFDFRNNSFYFFRQEPRVIL